MYWNCIVARYNGLLFDTAYNGGHNKDRSRHKKQIIQDHSLRSSL